MTSRPELGHQSLPLTPSKPAAGLILTGPAEEQHLEAEKAAEVVKKAEQLRTPSPKAPRSLNDRTTPVSADTSPDASESPSPRKPMHPRRLFTTNPSAPAAAAASTPAPLESHFANLSIDSNEDEDEIPAEIEFAIDQSFSPSDLDDSVRMPISPDDSIDAGSAPTTPQKPNVPETPIKKLTRTIGNSQARETWTPKRTQVLHGAEDKILSLPPELVPQACERLLNATFEVLEKPDSGFKIYRSPMGPILGVTNLKEGNVCWFMRVLKNISQRLKEITHAQTLVERNPILLLDLTHILSLEASEGGLSVRGQHVNKNYLANSCINPRSGVWCASQSTKAKLKESKFSTNLPLQFQNEQQVTDLVNRAIMQGTVIAEKAGRFLIQMTPDFFLEVVIRDHIRIPTIMPVLVCDAYAESKVIILDGFDGEKVIPTAYQIPLVKLLPFIRPEAALYTLENELIIDVAPLLQEAGIQCPVEKGILIRFPKTMFQKK
jgi:hypothetical protein